MRFTQRFSGIIFLNTIYSLVEMAIPAITMLIATPYLLSGMGVNSYGLWSLALAFLGLIGVVDIGIGAATTKFIAEFKESQDARSLSEIITTSFATSASLGATFTAILYFLSPWLALFFASSETPISQIVMVFQISTLGLLPMMLENIGLAIPRGFQDYRATTIILVLKNILTVVYAVWVVSNNGSVVRVMVGTIFILWVSAIGSLIVAYRKIQKIGIYIIFSLEAFRKIAKFMMFVGPTGIGIKIFTVFDRVIVAQTLGLSAGAYYNIATGIANKFSALASAATQALFPAFSTWSTTKDRGFIWKKIVTITLIIGFGAIIPGTALLIFSRPLVYWWLGKQNGDAVLYPMQILIFIYMVKAITSPSFQAAYGLGYPWITTLTVTMASLGTISLIVVLGKSQGLIGASWANIASWSLFIIPFYLYKILKQPNAGYSS